MGKKLIILLALFTAAAAGAFACEFTYKLTGPDGRETRITPGAICALEEGETYTLSVSYREDHRKCIVPPGDTLFLIEDERWKSGKDYLPLVLGEQKSWESDGRSYFTSFTFKAAMMGDWELQVLRECARGGYKAALEFQVA